MDDLSKAIIVFVVYGAAAGGIIGFIIGRAAAGSLGW